MRSSDTPLGTSRTPRMLHFPHRACHRGLARHRRRMIAALDHVVIAVRDLDVGIAAYQRLLGRPPCWRAEAAGGGGETAVFQLANVAAELIPPARHGPRADPPPAPLDTPGEGLPSPALAVGDIQTAHPRPAPPGPLP